jgi:asparagine synthase (glutamine-hydrolysing)
MCAISGLITKKAWRLEVIKSMCEIQKHRGPDYQGIYDDSLNNISLGHQRLSIIDTSNLGSQPMQSEDKRYVITFNGEIYNYIELKKELERFGYIFLSNSDTEVLLKAWIHWGESCLDKLTGMYVFSVYDKQKLTITIIRDKIGEKPLYYLHTQNTFAFASEFKAIMLLNGKEGKFNFDLNFTSDFFGLMWNPHSDGTLLSEVKRLEPSTILKYDVRSKNIELKKYWDLKVDPDISNLPYFEAVERYRELFEESVKLRLRSDVPVGVMLSGGLDSSAIAAFASNHIQNLHTYTLVFDNKNSEGKYAKEVAKHLGTRHEELHIDTKNIFDRIIKSIGHYDDLSTIDGGLISTKMMSDILKKNGAKVVLLGEGSDEINAGYGKFSLSKRPFNWLPAILRDSLFYYAMSRYSIFWKGYIKNSILSHRMIDHHEKNLLRQYTGYDIKHQLPNHLLMKVDRATMASSIEARVPFLDPELVSFAYSLPAEYKLHGKWFTPWKNNEKYILRDVARPYLPKNIIDRKKFGMMLPINDVLKLNLNYMQDVLMSSDSQIYQIYDKKFIEKMLRKSKQSYNNSQYSWFLWKATIFSLWCQHFRLSN